LTNAVKTGIKSDSLPDIGKFSSKAALSNGQGVLSFSSGSNLNIYNFKEGKT